MADLKTLQAYADKCANNLGIAEKPVLRWHTKEYECSMRPSILAHCHTGNETASRGTICLNRRQPIWTKVSDWHNTIAHEVTHLAVKSNHSSVTFARRMVSLGIANCNEKRMEKSGRRHRHIYDRCVHYRNKPQGMVRIRWECSLCGKPED